MAVTINGTTGLAVPLGSASAPSESNTTSATTGAYYPTGTTYALSTNGTNAVYIDASQNVGIGTTSVNTKLHVASSALADSIRWTDNTNSTAFLGTIAAASTIYTNTSLAFGTGSATFSEKMRINSSGNVGIGISAPANSLDVQNNTASQIRVGYVAGGATAYYDFGRDSADGLFGFNGAQSSFVGYKWKIQGTEAMRIDSSGNVGIGTTSPGYTLDVRATTGSISATSNTGTNYAKLQCNNSGGSYQFGIDNSAGSNFGSGTAYSRVIWNDSSTAPTILYTNSTERMRIDSSGNLLIGTTTLPIATSKLGISGASGVGVGVVSFVNTGSSTKKWSSGPDANGNYLVLNDASLGMYMGYGNTAWTANSDERLKTDLIPIENAASKVSLLRAVTGRFKTDEEGKSRSFLIAQDVQAVLPEAVDASDPDKLGVQYTDVIPLLVAAIKELSAEVEALKAKVGA